MAAHMPLKVPEKQKVLEIANVTDRLEYLMAVMEGEIDLLQVEKKNSFTRQKANGKKPA